MGNAKASSSPNKRSFPAGALSENDSLITTLLNSTAEGIYAVDATGTCTFANAACVTILGFDNSQELVGTNIHELVHGSQPDTEPQAVEDCDFHASGGSSEEASVKDDVMRRKDGTRFPVSYRSFPIVTDGEQQGTVVVFSDATEQRAATEEILRTEKMAELGKLSAGLAHELNNPAAAARRAAEQLAGSIADLRESASSVLNAVSRDEWDQFIQWESGIEGNGSRGASDLSPVEMSDREEELAMWLENHEVDGAWDMAPSLASSGVTSDLLYDLSDRISSGALSVLLEWRTRYFVAQDLANVINKSSNSISTLVGAVKSYSHMDTQSVQEVDLHQGLEDTLLILNHKLKSGITVVKEYDRSIPVFAMRGSQLNQVWTNLIDNAVAALDGSGTITLRTRKDGDNAIIEIQDDGPGIPAEIQERIFDPFFTTKEAGKGTGLGLDVAKQIVIDRCGGDVSVESRPGETVFRIMLPIQRLEK